MTNTLDTLKKRNTPSIWIIFLCAFLFFSPLVINKYTMKTHEQHFHDMDTIIITTDIN